MLETFPEVSQRSKIVKMLGHILPGFARILSLERSPIGYLRSSLSFSESFHVLIVEVLAFCIRKNDQLQK